MMPLQLQVNGRTHTLTVDSRTTVPGAEAILTGASMGRASANAAADRVLQGARGFGNNDFKIALVRSTLRGVLTEA